MDTKNNAMHVNPKHKWCKKNILVKNIEIENFSVEIFQTEHFNAENPQSTLFYKKMHEYEMKSFSKTLKFNPDLPKSRFSINLSSKRKH